MITWWDILTGRSTRDLHRAIEDRDERAHDLQEKIIRTQQEDRARDSETYWNLMDKITQLQRDIYEDQRKAAALKRIRPMRHKRPATPTPRIIR
jgi:hypothetical protein